MLLIQNHGSFVDLHVFVVAAQLFHFFSHVTTVIKQSTFSS